MTVGVRKTNADGKRVRGGSNGNERGGSDARRRRREWLVQTFRADVNVIRIPDLVKVADGWVESFILLPADQERPDSEPACRCFRCGTLLTVDMVSADRIKPGCDGGTYRRENIRPACYRCNSVTGATTRRKVGRR